MRCAHIDCLAERPRSKCSACLRVYYCSAECQRAAWSWHRRECAKLAQPPLALSKHGIKFEQAMQQAFERLVEAGLCEAALCYLAAVAAQRVPLATYVQVAWRGTNLVYCGLLPYDPARHFAIEPGCAMLRDPQSLAQPRPLWAPQRGALTLLLREDRHAVAVVVPLRRIRPTAVLPSAEVAAALGTSNLPLPCYVAAYNQIKAQYKATE